MLFSFFLIIHRNFERLTVVPLKVYYGNNTDKHGARLFERESKLGGSYDF